MAIAKFSPYEIDSSDFHDAFSALHGGELSGVVIFDAPHLVHYGVDRKIQLLAPWVPKIGDFTLERPTELGGTAFLPDMPAHIDPHAVNSLHVHITANGLARVRLANTFSPDLLDEYNEVNQFTLASSDVEIDEVDLQPGDAICFYGATTLHGFDSIGSVPRESFINVYSLIS